ncbi:MAG TPA: mechanosensitive ion channel family protein [Thermoanaerobaculia bacterium]|nr:mechanosensitive ion channel family protein [Thermoanaerobaculia bacterium]
MKQSEQAVEHRQKKDEVKKALAQAAPPEASPKSATHRRNLVWVGILGGLFVLLGAFWLLVLKEVVTLPGWSDSLTRRVPLTALILVGLLLAERLVETFAIPKITSPVSRYNITRVIRLVTGVLILGGAGTALFGNFYTGLVSLGVVSIIVGLAVQTPMTSFFGWIYILARAPYRVGDRVKIDDATGDVIEVNYLDTTLWEFGGQYLSTDHPSGRIIKFPNSKVLSSMVYNYSWPLFPYVWNEIKFNIAYESDLEFVAKTMKEVVEEHRGELMAKRVAVFRDLLAKTPVDELSVNDKPEVVFRPSENTWIEVMVRYLVLPKHAGRVKTELVKALLERLNQAPDKVLFPKGPSR